MAANRSDIAYADVTGKFKLLFGVEAIETKAKQVGVCSIIDLVCKALLKHSFTWQFS